VTQKTDDKKKEVQKVSGPAFRFGETKNALDCEELDGHTHILGTTAEGVRTFFAEDHDEQFAECLAQAIPLPETLLQSLPAHKIKDRAELKRFVQSFLEYWPNTAKAIQDAAQAWLEAEEKNERQE